MNIMHNRADIPAHSNATPIRPQKRATSGASLATLAPTRSAVALLAEREAGDLPMRAAIRRLIARRLLDSCPAIGLDEAREWAGYELERVERGVELGEVDKRLLLAAAERLMAEEAAGLGGAA